MKTDVADVTIIGAGAAGLMAGIWAGRTNPNRKILILDSAKKPGAKILVSGGGRCNVTHYRVEAGDYAGTSGNAIKNVLKHFSVGDTIAFFEELGIPLKKEETGKLFPTDNQSQTILKGLLDEVKNRHVALLYPRRVTAIRKESGNFEVRGNWGSIRTSKLILATGGKSLPKTGSDGLGYDFARKLGHTTTELIFPALVPLIIEEKHFIRSLSGITIPLTLTLHSGSGKKIMSFTDSTLCTHFGLSGPSILNISRYYIDLSHRDPSAYISVNWLPDFDYDSVNSLLLKLGNRSILRFLQMYLPERVILSLLQSVKINPSLTGGQLTKEQRKKLVHSLTEFPLPITGNRGFKYAEVTAGGIPLNEINLKTLESRLVPGLYFCGEILDVDGRIGGFNFQWAWASGYTAGISV